MDWISLGGRGHPPSPPQTPPHPAIYEGPPPLKLPVDRISPYHGVGCGAFLAGALFFCCAGPGSTNVIFGHLLTNVDIWPDLVTSHQSLIIPKS